MNIACCKISKRSIKGYGEAERTNGVGLQGLPCFFFRGKWVVNGIHILNMCNPFFGFETW